MQSNIHGMESPAQYPFQIRGPQISLVLGNNGPTFGPSGDGALVKIFSRIGGLSGIHGRSRISNRYSRTFLKIRSIPPDQSLVIRKDLSHENPAFKSFVHNVWHGTSNMLMGIRMRTIQLLTLDSIVSISLTALIMAISQAGEDFTNPILSVSIVAIQLLLMSVSVCVLPSASRTEKRKLAILCTVMCGIAVLISLITIQQNVKAHRWDSGAPGSPSR